MCGAYISNEVKLYYYTVDYYTWHIIDHMAITIKDVTHGFVDQIPSTISLRKITIINEITYLIQLFFDTCPIMGIWSFQ